MLTTAIAYPPATVTAFGGLTLQRHPTRDQLLPEGNAVPVCTLGPTHGRIERCLPSWRPAPVPAGVGTVCLKHVGPARVSTRSIVMRRFGGLLASHRTVLPAITWRRMVCGVRNSSSTTASLGVKRACGEVEARNGGAAHTPQIKHACLPFICRGVPLPKTHTKKGVTRRHLGRLGTPRHTGR